MSGLPQHSVDITQTHLEAAVIDQRVAGVMGNKSYAFVPVSAKGGGWALGVAVKNERGYNPIDGKTFDTRDEAVRWAVELNAHIGLDDAAAREIVISSMRRGSRA